VVGRDEGRVLATVKRHDAHSGLAVPGWTADELEAALRDCAAVVSCAGPFAKAGRPVIEAALRCGLPYTDSAGEQDFIRLVFDDFDAGARARGCCLVPAFGFDYVPGDLGAAIAAQGLGPLRSVDVVYAPTSLATSRGTRRTIAQGLTSREMTRTSTRQVTVPWGRVAGVSSPGGEAVTLPRHLSVQRVTTYTVLGLPAAVVGAAGVLASLPGVRSVVRAAMQGGPAGPEGRALDAPFAVHVQAEAIDGRRRAVLLEGRGAYPFTGEALAELAVRMASGRVDEVGSRAPAEVVEPREFCAAVGLSWRDVDPE
jgi:hypothetical protein